MGSTRHSFTDEYKARLREDERVLGVVLSGSRAGAGTFARPPSEGPSQARHLGHRRRHHPQAGRAVLAMWGTEFAAELGPDDQVKL